MNSRAIQETLIRHQMSMAISMRYYDDIPRRLDELQKHIETKKQRASMKKICAMHEKTQANMTLLNVRKIDAAIEVLALDVGCTLEPVDRTKRSKEYNILFKN
jgi:hypothetical protein